MNRLLTHADIIKGHRYKVIGTPKHLIGVMKYPWLNMTGVALWVDVGHNMVCIQFGGCKERGIPPECLEYAGEQAMIIDCANVPAADPGEGMRIMYEQLAREKAAEEAREKSMVSGQPAKINQLYRIVKTPPYWERISAKQAYPSLGHIGRLIKIRGSFGTLRLSDGVQRFVPFNCMELVTVRIPPLAETPMDLSDEALIEKMKLKPRSTLKIIKGLAHMNKDYRLRAFLDKGVIF